MQIADLVAVLSQVLIIIFWSTGEDSGLGGGLNVPGYLRRLFLGYLRCKARRGAGPVCDRGFRSLRRGRDREGRSGK
jgi:hypothetical protein